MSSLNVDRLRVFVSSTIQECSTERGIARAAIKSVNHEPILFEDIGARPHPPRDLYEARIEISHIFIGIYRESYGWVAPEMDISGMEDEYRIATRRGIARLIYILREPECRSAKLQYLIGEIKNAGLTFASYTEPEELSERIRDDLTATVSQRFADQAVIVHDAPSPDEVLGTLIPSPSHRLRRRAVEGELVARVREVTRLSVRAPLGGGKTVLLAQLADQEGWIFVDGRGLTHVEAMARIANAIRSESGRPHVSLATREQANRELVASWKERPEVTVVVDGAPDPSAVWRTSPLDRKLIVSSRSPLNVPPEHQFEVPVWTRGEIGEWMATVRNERPDPNEVARLAERSGGLPLYLRLFVTEPDQAADLTLQELEIRAVESLAPQAREITTYLALSSIRLSLEDLRQLLSIEGGPEAVAEQVSAAAGLLAHARGHPMLVHEHLRTTILDRLRLDPVKLAFFGNRIGALFERTARPLAAFHAYLAAEEELRADGVLGRAVNQALAMGGGKPAIPALRRQVIRARDRGASQDRLQALLNLALALEQTGNTDTALTTLREARAIAREHDEPQFTLRVREAEAIMALHDRPRSERIDEFKTLRNACVERGDTFNAARTGTLLTAEYISADDFDLAHSMAREVLAEFKSLGDEYGVRLAQLNLAAGLSGIPGREAEASAIVQEIEQEVPADHLPRARAVLCNLLTRHYRRLGHIDQAKRFALEAIDIGKQLDDQRVIARNLINLGNLLSDEDKMDEALVQ